MGDSHKRHFHSDCGASTDQVFTSLDTMQIDNEDETDELMNDFDTEFIAPEEIELAGNPQSASVLKRKANVHVFDEWITHAKELETNKKKKTPQENTPITWKCNVLHILVRIQLLISMSKLLILVF